MIWKKKNNKETNSGERERERQKLRLFSLCFHSEVKKHLFGILREMSLLQVLSVI